MGRYAYFSTGFEYKFWFAVQPSEDIWEFGGNNTTEETGGSVAEGDCDGDCDCDCDCGHEEAQPEHEWVASEDLDYIISKLLDCAKENGVKLPDFDSFEKSVDGTNSMWNTIETYEFKEPKVHAWFFLGCVIYHQLLYTDDGFLSVTYEL